MFYEYRERSLPKTAFLKVNNLKNNYRIDSNWLMATVELDMICMECSGLSTRLSSAGICFAQMLDWFPWRLQISLNFRRTLASRWEICQWKTRLAKIPRRIDEYVTGLMQLQVSDGTFSCIGNSVVRCKSEVGQLEKAVLDIITSVDTGKCGEAERGEVMASGLMVVIFKMRNMTGRLNTCLCNHQRE